MSSTESGPALPPSSVDGGANGGDGGITDHTGARPESFGGLDGSGGVDGFGGFGKSFITDNVGRGMTNNPEDVFRVSRLLSENGFLREPTRTADEEFMRGIETGQQKLHELTDGGLRVDGRVNPLGPTEIVAQRAITGGQLRMPEERLSSDTSPATTPKLPPGSAPSVAASTPGQTPAQQAATVNELQTRQQEDVRARRQASNPPPRPSLRKQKERLGMTPPSHAANPSNPMAATPIVPRLLNPSPGGRAVQGQDINKLVDAFEKGQLGPRVRMTANDAPVDFDKGENRLPRQNTGKGLVLPEKPQPFIDPVDGADGLPGDPAERAQALRVLADIAKHEKILRGFEEEVREAAGNDAARAFREKVDADRKASQEKIQREEAERTKQREAQRRKEERRRDQTDPIPENNAEIEKSLFDQFVKSLDDFFSDPTNIPSETPPLDPPNAGPPPPINNRPGAKPRRSRTYRPSGKLGLIRKIIQQLSGR